MIETDETTYTLDTVPLGTILTQDSTDGLYILELNVDVYDPNAAIEEDEAATVDTTNDTTNVTIIKKKNNKTFVLQSATDIRSGSIFTWKNNEYSVKSITKNQRRAQVVDRKVALTTRTDRAIISGMTKGRLTTIGDDFNKAVYGYENWGVQTIQLLPDSVGMSTQAFEAGNISFTMDGATKTIDIETPKRRDGMTVQEQVNLFNGAQNVYTLGVENDNTITFAGTLGLNFHMSFTDFFGGLNWSTTEMPTTGTQDDVLSVRHKMVNGEMQVKAYGIDFIDVPEATFDIMQDAILLGTMRFELNAVMPPQFRFTTTEIEKRFITLNVGERTNRVQVELDDVSLEQGLGDVMLVRTDGTNTDTFAPNAHPFYMTLRNGTIAKDASVDTEAYGLYENVLKSDIWAGLARQDGVESSNKMTVSAIDYVSASSTSIEDIYSKYTTATCKNYSLSLPSLEEQPGGVENVLNADLVSLTATTITNFDNPIATGTEVKLTLPNENAADYSATVKYEYKWNRSASKFLVFDADGRAFYQQLLTVDDVDDVEEGQTIRQGSGSAQARGTITKVIEATNQIEVDVTIGGKVSSNTIFGTIDQFEIHDALTVEGTTEKKINLLAVVNIKDMLITTAELNEKESQDFERGIEVEVVAAPAFTAYTNTNVTAVRDNYLLSHVRLGENANPKWFGLATLNKAGFTGDATFASKNKLEHYVDNGIHRFSLHNTVTKANGILTFRGDREYDGDKYTSVSLLNKAEWSVSGTVVEDPQLELYTKERYHDHSWVGRAHGDAQIRGRTIVDLGRKHSGATRQ